MTRALICIARISVLALLFHNPRIIFPVLCQLSARQRFLIFFQWFLVF